jgi:hypothetical protein
MLSLQEFKECIGAARDAAMHEAEDDYSRAFAGAMMALLADFLISQRRIADALERLGASTH